MEIDGGKAILTFCSVLPGNCRSNLKYPLVSLEWLSFRRDDKFVTLHSVGIRKSIWTERKQVARLVLINADTRRKLNTLAYVNAQKESRLKFTDNYWLVRTFP